MGKFACVTLFILRKFFDACRPTNSNLIIGLDEVLRLFYEAPIPSVDGADPFAYLKAGKQRTLDSLYFAVVLIN